MRDFNTEAHGERQMFKKKKNANNGHPIDWSINHINHFSQKTSSNQSSIDCQLRNDNNLFN